MPNEAPPLQPASAIGQPAVGALTPERIERVLADFRDWFESTPVEQRVPTSHEQSGESLRNGSIPGESGRVDLQTLVGQFVALRHEVNLQTKSSRASLEQNAAALLQLEEAVAELREQSQPALDNDAELKPLLKAMIDAHDALALAARQVERQREKILAGLDVVVQSVAIDPPPEITVSSPGKPGFWQRALGGSASPSTDAGAARAWRDQTMRLLQEREQSVRDASQFLRQALDGLLTGYTMSLNRIERALPQFGLEAMECLGERFDPEIMEVVEAVADSGKPAGEVIEEVRRGYIWKEAVFRYAQVRVAR